MSILVSSDSKVIVQGLTGSAGMKYAASPQGTVVFGDFRGGFKNVIFSFFI